MKKRQFISNMSPDFETFLDYREALGYLRETHERVLKSFDKFCIAKHPQSDCLTKEMVLDWLEEQHDNATGKARTIRLLGKHLTAVGKESFILPDKLYPNKSSYHAHVFTDAELRSLFTATDNIENRPKEPFLNETIPVLLRLIYTCGLRPWEGRELLCRNVNLLTGEILITDTKGKKDRVVVMSDDMLKLCSRYDESRRIFAKGNQYFFPSWNSGECFTAKQLDRIFKNCWWQANANVAKGELPSVRIYDLRHRFASACLNRWLDNGTDLSAMLPYLWTFMGHVSISETAYYVHLLPENLVKSAGIDWESFGEIVPEVTLWQ
jgi:integrase